MKKRRWVGVWKVVWVCALLAGCAAVQPEQVARRQQITLTRLTPSPTPTAAPTATLSPTPPPPPEIVFWIDPDLPEGLTRQARLPDGARLAANESEANVKIAPAAGDLKLGATWVYALVVPFPTVRDDAFLDDIRRAWTGSPPESFAGQPLMMSPGTRKAFEAIWGPAVDSGVQVLADEELLPTAWARRSAWALVPFDELEPRWKVLRVDGVSPLEKNLDAQRYPLVTWFGVTGAANAVNALPTNPRLLPETNRDERRMTHLLMTGVTALVRAVGWKMETQGMFYPAQDILPWLQNADVTHISNEASFNPNCPAANPSQYDLSFCSRPEYIELLDLIGTDVVELSGNHVNDKGREPFLYSLDLYHQRGWGVFAGGANLEEALKPALIEHNGNKLAFIGCNPAGPAHAWATETHPGAAPCDSEKIQTTLTELRGDGYLPVMTFQYYENYFAEVGDRQVNDFAAMARAGAVIVSGSQAHLPQGFAFESGAMIHYGLGNLFFDQMDIPVVGTRREFLDRHVIYDGRLISTELLTAMLEDYARPRPMTTEERAEFLATLFTASGWPTP